jgi:hypothetical protein
MTKTIKMAAICSTIALGSASGAFAGGLEPFVDCQANPNQEGCATVVVAPGPAGSLGGLGTTGAIVGGLVGVAILAAIINNDDDNDDDASATTTE